MNAAQEALIATVENGGGTFFGDTLMPVDIRRGYAVGVGGVTLDPAKVTDEVLREWATRVGQEWGTSFVGTWLDNGIFYLDAVQVFAEGRRAAALEAARSSGQKAIYDFATHSVVSVTEEPS